METRQPHNFSLGVCRLTMTIELGSKDTLVWPPQAEHFLLSRYTENVFTFSATINFGSVNF
jgi:hypothetical protein